MTVYDCAVIGGGLGGLTSAALLAKRGQRVLVLEARDRFGGLTSTADIAPGVPSDVVDHDLGWVPPSVLSELNLQQHGLELIAADPCTTALSQDGEPLTLYRDVKRTAGVLARVSQKDAAAWKEYAQRVERLSGFLQSLYEVPAPSLFATGAGNLVTLLGLGRKARSLGRDGIFDLLRTLPMSIADVLDETFENATLKGLLALRGVKNIQQGPKSGATAFLFLHHHVGAPRGAIAGSLTARGGVGALAHALTAAAKAHGAVLRTGARVSRIDVRAERVHAVVLDSGEEIPVTTVVSTLDARRTFDDLIDPVLVEPELSRALGNVRYRGAVAKVNLVLDGTLPLPNVDELARGMLVIAPTMGYLERAFDKAKHGQLAPEPALEIRVPSALDPTLQGPGKHVGVSVHVQWAPYRIKQGSWDAATRDALSDHVMRTIEQVIPGFTNRIIERRVLSPADIESQYGASEGSLTHGELALDQILFMRPVPSLSRYAANGIQGLYVAGRGCHPGMALPAAQLAAREITRGARSRDSAAPPAA
ncbi:MAG: NAD(P)/FAD-dependent oxidoreductase [Gemmatimonadota bacterium]